MSADIFPPEKRSAIMREVRSRYNKSTELALIAAMSAHGIKGWRRGYPLRGSPDFVFTKQRLAIFVDGCFWHDCPEHGHVPSDNHDFWAAKLKRNAERDTEVNAHLKRKNWRVLRIWEHQLKKREQERVARLVKQSLNAA